MRLIIARIFSLRKNIYVKNAAFLLSDNIIRILIGFIMSVLVARYFGPQKFGTISYVAAFIAILQVFVLFGFDGNVLKDLGLELYPESTILGTVTIVRFFLAGIAFGIGLGIFYFFLDKSLINIYVIMGTQFFFNSFYIFKQWYQIKSLNKYTVISSQISIFVVTIAKICVILLSKDVIWYAVVITGGVIIDSIVLFLFFRHNSTISLLQKINTSYAKRLFKLSLPLLLSNFSIMIFMRIDILMIGKLLSSYEVGIYSIAVTIAEVFNFLPMSIANAVYPKIAEAKKQGNDYEAIIVKTCSLNIFFGFIFALFCTACVPFLVKYIYGEAYSLVGNVVQIYSWESIFTAIGVSHSCFLIFNNMQNCYFVANTSSMILNIILNFILIPLYGINGAAIATVISSAFMSYFFYIFIKDKRTFLLRTKSLFFKR